MISSRFLARTSAFAASLLCVTLLSGCYSEGGPGFALDQQAYVSRPWTPWTVTLRDTRTGQEFWSMDVPVGKRLIVSFSTDTGTKDKYTPDKMNWALVDENEDFAVRLSNSIPVPPANARRLEPTLRTVPELPENMVTVTKGSLPPARVQSVRPSTVTVPTPPMRDSSDQPVPLPDTAPATR